MPAPPQSDHGTVGTLQLQLLPARPKGRFTFAIIRLRISILSSGVIGSMTLSGSHSCVGLTRLSSSQSLIGLKGLSSSQSPIGLKGLWV